MTDQEPSEPIGDGPPPMPAGLADEQFAANVRDERERKQMSQADLAARMRERGWSWHPQTVQKIEAGHRKVSVGEAEALARLLGTTMERLTWPGRAASAAAFLDAINGRAISAWGQVESWTSTLMYSQWQLGITADEAERAGFYGMAEIREMVTEARDVLTWTPEGAVESGRKDFAKLRETGDEDELAEAYGGDVPERPPLRAGEGA